MRLLILVFLIPSFLYSQHEMYDEFIPKFKSEILDSTNIKKSRTSRILRDLSFTGAYKELYEMDSYIDTTIESYFTNLIKDAALHEAKEYILENSKTRRILITNESHNRPEHRVFTSSLLKDLYQQGFRYLALEAMLSTQFYNSTVPPNSYNLADTTIMDRGYPLMKAMSGTYVKEPQFGNMIREAIKLGFVIIGYEKFGKGRELNQAKNIARVYELDPAAKIIVHCGFGHLIEVPRTRQSGKVDTFMAGHLKRITGFDPFTVDQTNYAQCSGVDELIFGNREATLPLTFVNKGEAFKSIRKEEQDYWDLTIFHKPVTYINGRPSWLVHNSANVFEFDVSQVKIDFPVRIELLEGQDRLDAVPIDIMEMEALSESKLHLYGNIENGKFVVENMNSDRQVIYVVGKANTLAK